MGPRSGTLTDTRIWDARGCRGNARLLCTPLVSDPADHAGLADPGPGLAASAEDRTISTPALRRLQETLAAVSRLVTSSASITRPLSAQASGMMNTTANSSGSVSEVNVTPCEQVDLAGGNHWACRRRRAPLWFSLCRLIGGRTAQQSQRRRVISNGREEDSARVYV